MPINYLPDLVVRGADRAHVWFNVLMGVTIALSLPMERTWKTEPMWMLARQVPWSPYSWALALAAAVAIYTWGSFLSLDNPHRGRVVIFGALLCAAWYMALALSIARETYVQPKEVSSIWPVLLFFISLMYAHRAVLYSNTFTGSRWATDPFQLYDISFLLLVSLAQVVIGVSPQSVQAQFDRGTQVSLAFANMVGACIALVGLHLKRLETGLWVELWGYISLTLTLAFYCYQLLISTTGPIATLGFTLSEAFVFASLHRAIQVIRYKYHRKHRRYDIADPLFKQLTHGYSSVIPTTADQLREAHRVAREDEADVGHSG